MPLLIRLVQSRAMSAQLSWWVGDFDQDLSPDDDDDGGLLAHATYVALMDAETLAAAPGMRRT